MPSRRASFAVPPVIALGLVAALAAAAAPGKPAAPPAATPELVVQALDRSVSAAVLSRDGRWLVTGSGERRVQVWDAKTGTLRRSLRGEGQITSVDLSAGGETIAAAGLDGTVRLWERERGTVIAVLPADPRGAVAVRFSPVGPHLATAGSQGVKLWHAGTGKRLRTLLGTLDTTSAGAWSRLDPGLEFSPDGRVLAAPAREGWSLWDPATGARLRQLPRRLDQNTAVAFSPDGKLLATAQITARYTLPVAEIALWRVATGELVRVLNTGGTEAISLSFSPDGRTLLAGTRFSRGLQVWDVEGGQRVRTVASLTDAVQLSRSGRVLASWSTDFGSPGPRVRTWRVSDLRGGEVVLQATFPGSPSLVSALQTTPAGETLVAAGTDGRIWRWNAGTARQERSAPAPDGVTGRVVLSTDGATAAALAVDRVVVWDAVTGAVRRTLRAEGVDYGESALALPGDGRRLAVIGPGWRANGPSLRLQWWNVTTGQRAGSLSWTNTALIAQAASPAADELIAGVTDLKRDARELRVVDLRTGQIRRKVPLTGAAWSSVAVSRDGALAAVPAHDAVEERWDYPVDVWRLGSGERLARLRGFQRVADQVAFSPAGARVAAGDYLGEVRVWSVGRDTPVTTLRAHPRSISALSFLGEDRIATAGEDGEVALWELPSGKRLATLLTFPEGEWLAYRPDHRYTGSPGIEKRLAWRVSGRMLPGAQLRRHFHIEALLGM